MKSSFNIHAFIVSLTLIQLSGCSVDIKAPPDTIVSSSTGSSGQKTPGAGASDKSKSSFKPSDFKSIDITNTDIEGYYEFSFRISTWNSSCLDQEGKEEFRIKDGVPQKDWSAAYGWYYKIEKTGENTYQMTRYINSNLDEFSDENQKQVKADITKDGKLSVKQTFEYGLKYANSAETLTMDGAFTSETEIKGNYSEFSDVKTGSYKSCTTRGEYTMKKKKNL